ncbi:MAG TPA: hypothetical protein PLO65_10645 [Caulobacter sp.]|nr:hypothetical protein [Caulobacter sp.]
MKFRPFTMPDEIGSEPDPDLEQYFTLYRDELFDGFVGHGLVSIRQDWPPDLIGKIAAAVVSNNLGIGLDHAYKRYCPPENYRRNDDPEVPKLDAQFERDFDNLCFALNESYAFEKADDAPEQDFFSAFGILRARGMLDAAHALAQQGYLSETLILVRGSLEILAWAAEASVFQEDYRPLELTTQFAITKSKATIPGLAQIYGTLSKFAHWHPDTHLAFLLGRSGRTAVRQRSVEHKAAALLAVASGQLTVAITFLANMQRWYPTHDMSDVRAAASQMAQSGDAIVSLMRVRQSPQRLVADLARPWSLLKANSHLVSVS